MAPWIVQWTAPWWIVTKLFKPIINKLLWLRLLTWAFLTTALMEKSSLLWHRPLLMEPRWMDHLGPSDLLLLRALLHSLLYQMPRFQILVSRGKRRDLSELKACSEDLSTKRLRARQTCLSKTNWWVLHSQCKYQFLNWNLKFREDTT